VPQQDSRAAHLAAGPCPDSIRLAEYVDGMLDETQRRDVQAHLVSCAACRDIVAETVRVLRRPAGVDGGLSTLRFRARRRTVLWIGGLAAVAAVLFGVYLARPDRLFGPPTDRPELSGLVAAMAKEPTRPAEGRLSGGFTYAPAPIVTRGSRERRTSVSPDLLAAAAKLEETALASPTAENRAAAGVARLILGDLDEAIDSLESAVRQKPTDANALSDLSAAYSARARWLDRPDDWSKALDAAERSLKIAPQLAEASFNRALALEGLGQYAAAADAWAAVGTLTSLPAWLSEAVERERNARARARQ
jgi:hypothetical protein